MSFEEQIMSKDKYPSLFSRKMEVLYYPSNIFHNTHDFQNGGIFSDVKALEYSSRDVFRLITRERKYVMDYNEKFKRYDRK